jgi:hypothetical protein
MNSKDLVAGQEAAGDEHDRSLGEASDERNLTGIYREADAFCLTNANS